MFSFILWLAILSFYDYLVTFYDGIHIFALLLPKFRGHDIIAGGQIIENYKD